MKQLDLKDLNLGQAVWTPEHGQQAQAQMRQQIESANLNTTMMVEIGQWAERVLENPKQFPAFQAWLKQQGLPDSDIPEAPDVQELAAMAAMGRVSGEIDSEQASAAAPVAESGPVSPEQMAGMAQQGRSGDTQLAHINPEEAAMLEAAGGMGTINPATGLPEYGFFRDLWNGIKKVAKAVAPFVLPVAAIFFPPLIPAIGTFLGASGAMAGIVGAAAISGGVTALSGGSIKDVLTSAALTGLGAYLAPVVGGYAGKLTGITDPGILSSIGSAAIAGGATALRGGTVGQILTAAATGGAASYLGQLATNVINSNGITNTKITQKVFDDANFAAADAKGLADAGLSKMQIQQTLISTGLAPDVAATVATAAAAGQTAQQMAIGLSNKYAGMPPANTKSTQPNLYMNDASGVTNSIIGGANIKALEQVQRYEDGMLRTEQAREFMATANAQGLTGRAAQPQIEAKLIADGVDPTSARFIAGNLVEGKTTGAISEGIVNSLPNAKLYGDKPAPVAAAPAAPAPVTPAAPAAPAAIYTPDTYADAEFIMADVKQQYEQGISGGQIIRNLEQAGYSTNAATNAVGVYQAGRPVESMASTLATTYARGGKPDGLAPVVAAPVAPTPAAPVNNTESDYVSNMTETVTPGTGTDPVANVELTAPVAPTPPPAAAPAPPPMNLSEAQFLAADAAQLAAQTGNNALAIEQNLVYSGVDPVIAATAANMAAVGTSVAGMTQQLSGQTAPLYLDNSRLAPWMPPGTETITLANGQLAFRLPGQSDLYTYNGDIIPNATAPAAAPAAAPAPRPETDASFAAADAAQLHQQKLTQAQIEATLLYSGMDPMVAADAAQAAAQGYDAATIQQLITQSGTTTVGTPPVIYAGSTPQAPLPGYGGPPGSAPPATYAPPALTPAQTGAIVATPIINNAANPPAPAPATQYSFTPQPADPRWSQPLQYPGLNPGMIGAGVRPAYATTSPVQSQFYWGRQPQFDQVSDLDRYNQVPGMPAQPWGLQQSFFEQPAGAAPLAPAAPAAYNPAYTPATTPGYPVMAQPQMTMNKFGQLVPVDPLERTGTFAAAPGVAPQASQYTPIT
jgi:hypothetical protein